MSREKYTPERGQQVKYTDYDAEEAQAVLEEARRELDPYLAPDADPSEVLPVLVAVAGELLEVGVATLTEVEELRDELRSAS